MTEQRKRAIELSLGGSGSLTSGIVDRERATIVIRSATSPEERSEIIQIVLAFRARWRTWLTLTQREWQAKESRRPQRGRHHDSWSIREKYVRCPA